MEPPPTDYIERMRFLRIMLFDIFFFFIIMPLPCIPPDMPLFIPMPC